MASIKGTPIQGLAGATLGFFIGFAAVDSVQSSSQFGY